MTTNMLDPRALAHLHQIASCLEGILDELRKLNDRLKFGGELGLAKLERLESELRKANETRGDVVVRRTRIEGDI